MSAYAWLQVLTLIRIPLAIVVWVIAETGGAEPWSVWTILALLAGIELSDLADGQIARRCRLKSELGAMLDPYADSVSRLIVAFAFAATGWYLFLVPAVMALRDVTVAYCRIIMARSGRTVGANISGKLKAVIQGAATFAVCAALLWWPAQAGAALQIISWAVIVSTALSAIQYLVSAAGAFSNDPRGS